MIKEIKMTDRVENFDRMVREVSKSRNCPDKYRSKIAFVQYDGQDYRYFTTGNFMYFQRIDLSRGDIFKTCPMDKIQYNDWIAKGRHNKFYIIDEPESTLEDIFETEKLFRLTMSNKAGMTYGSNFAIPSKATIEMRGLYFDALPFKNIMIEGDIIEVQHEDYHKPIIFEPADGKILVMPYNGHHKEDFKKLTISFNAMVNDITEEQEEEGDNSADAEASEV